MNHREATSSVVVVLVVVVVVVVMVSFKVLLLHNSLVPVESRKFWQASPFPPCSGTVAWYSDGSKSSHLKIGVAALQQNTSHSKLTREVVHMINLKEFSCFRPLSISSYLYFYCYQKGFRTFTIYIERKRSQIFMPINDNMCTFLFSCLFVCLFIM